MDAKTLQALTSQIDFDRCRQLIPGLYEAFRLADLNTVKRRAMWFAQVLEESAGLSATTEFASGEEYEGRIDLGNTEPGDGPRFKGRGFIQVTGRAHYGDFSRWCHRRRLVANDHWFVDHPEQVASDAFAWISAAWYWRHPHPHDGLTFLNEAADAGDVLIATHMVNGGEHGLTIRQHFYADALRLGDELMSPVDPGDPNWSEVMTRDELNEQIDHRLRHLMLGNDALHEKMPATFGERDKGVRFRLRDHDRRLAALENQPKP